jgi:hypothetical protein
MCADFKESPGKPDECPNTLMWIKATPPCGDNASRDFARSPGEYDGHDCVSPGDADLDLQE